MYMTAGAWTLTPGPAGAATVVVFGGINSGVGLPPFEFERTLGQLGASCLFVRDPRQAWYNQGLPGVGSSGYHVEQWLIQMMRQRASGRVVFVGNSAGGFAALRFAPACRPDSVLVFSPQTFIDRFNRLRHLDLRWSRQVERAHWARPPGAVWDVVPLLGPRMPCPTEVHVAMGHRLDRAHAERLRHIDRLTLVEHEGGGHTLVRELRDDGQLVGILRRLCSDGPGAAGEARWGGG
jgi:hypothetical protein